jgi:hypothetical protein
VLLPAHRTQQRALGDSYAGRLHLQRQGLLAADSYLVRHDVAVWANSFLSALTANDVA